MEHISGYQAMLSVIVEMPVTFSAARINVVPDQSCKNTVLCNVRNGGFVVGFLLAPVIVKVFAQFATSGTAPIRDGQNLTPVRVSLCLRVAFLGLNKKKKGNQIPFLSP